MGHEYKESRCKPMHWANTGDMMGDMLLELTDKAWEQLMLEKMKTHFEKHRGAQMDKMAESAVKTSLTYWLNKMKSHAELHKAYHELKQNMS